MDQNDRLTDRQRGFSLIEVSVSLAVLGVFIGGAVSAMIWSQRAFVENQIASVLSMRAQRAMERIVRLGSQALTSDAGYSPLKATSGVNSHAVRFRLLASIDAVTGEATYDDNARVYIYGPDGGDNPNAGIIVGRGPSLDAIHAAASGPDGTLGTIDDNTQVSIAGGVPAVELLVPAEFRPRSGEMFTLSVTPAPTGRLLSVTLRLNAMGPDGDFVFDDDVVLTERISLRQ